MRARQAATARGCSWCPAVGAPPLRPHNWATGRPQGAGVWESNWGGGGGNTTMQHPIASHRPGGSLPMRPPQVPLAAGRGHATCPLPRLPTGFSFCCCCFLRGGCGSSSSSPSSSSSSSSSRDTSSSGWRSTWLQYNAERSTCGTVQEQRSEWAVCQASTGQARAEGQGTTDIGGTGAQPPGGPGGEGGEGARASPAAHTHILPRFPRHAGRW